MFDIRMLFDVLACLALAGWALFSMTRIIQGRLDSVNVVILVHVFFAGVPLALDYLIGAPGYERHNGFYRATTDDTVAIIYDVFVVLVPTILYSFGRSRRRRDARVHSLHIRQIGLPSAICWALLVPVWLPLLLVLLSGQDRAFLDYGNVAFNPDSGVSPGFAFRVSIAALGSIVAGFLILLSTKRLNVGHLLIVGLPMAASAWIHGKRFAVALCLALAIFVFWNRGVAHGRKLIVYAGIAGLAFGAYTLVYQGAVRSEYVRIDSDVAYENGRIDFGRDSRIKTAIYAELHPDDITILDYRGQSVVLYATLPVPRAIWPDKPYPYPVYATAAAFDIPPRYLGWGVTTSILDEAIANFSWPGMLIGPLLVAFICRIGDHAGNVAFRFLTVLVATLLLALHLIAFLPLVLLWMVAGVLSFVRVRRRPGRRRRPRKHPPTQPTYPDWPTWTPGSV